MTANQRSIPHNLDAERALIGAMLLSDSAIASTIDEVSPAECFAPQHQLLMGAIVELWSRGLPTDPVTVMAHLADAGHEVDSSDVHRIFNETPSISSASHYASIIRGAARSRQLIHAGSNIIDLGYNATRTTVDDAWDQAEGLLGSGTNAHDDVEVTAADAVSELEDLLALRANTPGDYIGVPTGFTDWDTLTLGMQPGTLNVVAGRPGMTKSVFALEAALHASLGIGVPVLFGSLEMGRVELAARMVSSLAGVDGQKLRLGNIDGADAARITQSQQLLADAPLTIVDDATMTLLSLRSHARRLRTKHGSLGLIVVDYLQLMTAGSDRLENRQLEVAHIARG